MRRMGGDCLILRVNGPKSAVSGAGQPGVWARILTAYECLFFCIFGLVGLMVVSPPVLARDSVVEDSGAVEVQDIPAGDFDGLCALARDGDVPRTRWTHQPDHILWNRAALSALKDHGRPLVEMTPGDVTDWCPRYPGATDADRRAFWVGFLSALARHENTYRPRAVGGGGGGKWYGLLQILPATARGYKCTAGTGEALKNGAANLSCAVRIMAVTVPRDGVIYGRGGRGVAADWGPMRSASKRADMAGWLKRQPYCAPLDAMRPLSRPAAPE